MSKRFKYSRRDFVKGLTVGVPAAAALTGCQRKVEVKEVTKETDVSAGKPMAAAERVLLAQCPYCGVGCGSTIHVDKTGKILGVQPDRQHPTNRGVQCIKGLNADEPIYVDRLTKVLVRKDMSDPVTGHVSATKGRFDESVFRETTLEEAEEIIAHKVEGILKKKGGNAVGLYGSGQLTVETQWVENKLLKGVLGSNSIEANARTCMTSAVTAYFKTLGSDTPPLCYDDIELSDMITFWGHNARAAHTIVFWRVVDHKAKNGIPTLVSDPRRTDTVKTLEGVDPTNSAHFQTINGDISLLNALGHCLVTEHEDVIDYAFLREHTTGWEAYIDMVRNEYRPEDIQHRTMVDPKLVREVAAQWADATRKGRQRGTGGVLSFWGIGYNQHIHGQHNVISIINLHALTGNIGRPGAGPFSMTGQPNAMGERLMGGLTGRLPFNQGMKNIAWRKHIAESWNVPLKNLDNSAKSDNKGMMVGMFERALYDYEKHPNPLMACFYSYTTHVHQPDLNTLIRPALSKMFVVVQDIYRHAPNLLYGDIILPALTWGEWSGGTYISSERRINVVDGVGKGAAGLDACLPDLDLAIIKGKNLCKVVGLDPDKVFPYPKRKMHPDGPELYDPEAVFEEIVKSSKGADCDLTGMLEVQKRDGIGLYDQLRQLRGVQWPAPTYEIAQKGGTERRFRNQEEWTKALGRPYGSFRTKTGRMNIVPCRQVYEQDYGKLDAKVKKAREWDLSPKQVLEAMSQFGTVLDKDVPMSDEARKHAEAHGAVFQDRGVYAVENPKILRLARDYALTPEMPDAVDDPALLDVSWQEMPKGKYPFWLGLGIVYEHFHTAKTIRGATTRRLVPEQYVEMHPVDAEKNGLRDGERVRLVTRRGSFQARVSISAHRSKVRPARNEVRRGYLFSPWNLSVADSADPRLNKWLVNATSHRAYDPVSGQVDYKKLAARIERV